VNSTDSSFGGRGPRPHRGGLILVLLLAAGLVAALFPGPLRHPGAYLYGDQGDAIKNYFVLGYYTQYDHGNVFTGMNYPRGEHVNYPDLQPLLAMPLGWARLAGLPVTATTGIAATNILLLLALVATAGVLYTILRQLLLPGWYAGTTALLLTFLAPQLLRFQGHMSLGYACIVPVQWYLLLRALAAPRRPGWWLALGIFNLLMGGLAAYHLGIGSLWLLAHALVLGLQTGWRRNAPVLGRLVTTALVPLLVFRAWLFLTDPVLDRPLNPWGLLANNASFVSLFTPSQGPLKGVWQALFHTEEPVFEGAVYVGFVGLLVGLCTLGLTLRYARRQQWGRLGRPVLPTPLRTSLLATSLLLLLAMALPFRLPGLQELVVLLGPLKQFRSLGRFAWPFYYVFGSYAAFYLYRLWRYLRQHRVPAFATMWLVPLLLLWGTEAAWQVVPVAQAIAERESAAMLVSDKDNYQELLGWSSTPANHFQALLPLPYFIAGTDKIAIEGTAESLREAYRAALNLHLPLLTMFTGRAPVGETLRLTQLLSSPLLSKELLPQLPSNKPILLLVTPQPLSLAEQRLVALAHRVAGNDRATLYELPISTLAATTLAAERQKAAGLLPTLTSRAGLATSTGKGSIYQDFAQAPDHRGRLGTGAFFEAKEGFATLYNGPLPMPADTGRYEVSVWVNAQTAYGLGNMQVKVYHQGQLLSIQATDARHTTEISGDWVRVAVEFRRPAEADRLEVLYESRDLVADDLLIRPLDTDVYWRAARGQLVLNGYSLGQ
jgi:hypothetical protein